MRHWEMAGPCGSFGSGELGEVTLTPQPGYNIMADNQSDSERNKPTNQQIDGNRSGLRLGLLTIPPFNHRFLCSTSSLKPKRHFIPSGMVCKNQFHALFHLDLSLLSTSVCFDPSRLLHSNRLGLSNQNQTIHYRHSYMPSLYPSKSTPLAQNSRPHQDPFIAVGTEL